MRVQLTRRRRDERGAIALLAAFLATGLLIISAFTLDFGLAYTSKQQLQEAADAGALAAAQVYKGHTGSCATLAADSVLEQQAQQAADAWAEQNRPGKVGGTIAVSCSADGLTVTYDTTGQTPVGLGQLAGGGSTITTSRIAAATIGKATKSVGGLRPWGICSGVATTSGNVTFVPMAGGSTTSEDSTDLCGSEKPPGGWWVAQCTGQVNGIPATKAAVLNGCAQTAYQPVPGQPSDPQTLLTYLQQYCPKKTENDTCLSSDTGSSYFNTSDDWQTLVGKSFTMPVICSQPTCAQVEYTAQGSTATYAIQRMATVTLCGFEFPPRGASTGWPSTGPCHDNNPKNYKSSDVTNSSDGGLFLVVTSLTGGPGGDWTLEEYTAMRLTR